MAAAFFSSTLVNTPDNSDDEEDLDGPVFGPELPALFKIYEQPEKIQISKIEQANIAEVFSLYCDSDEGKRLVMKSAIPKYCCMRIHINPKSAQIQIGGFINQLMTFEYKLADVTRAEDEEDLIETNFDGVQLKMSIIRESVYAVRTANVKEDFMMLVEAFRTILNAELISLKYNFDLENDWDERVKSYGEMKFSMENLDFLLDFFVGKLPLSIDQFNSAQTIGLVFRSVNGKHENLTTSISDVIQCVENILRNDVWEDSTNMFAFKNGLLKDNEDKLFCAVRKYNEPSGSSEVVLERDIWEREEKIVNFDGDTALISISPSRTDSGIDIVNIRMMKTGQRREVDMDSEDMNFEDLGLDLDYDEDND